jgi:hypothetical protein
MEKTFDIKEFKGLHDYGSPMMQPGFTRSLNAVLVRYGRLVGAKGLQKLRSISTAASNSPIIALMPYYTSDLSTTLYRMTTTKVEQLNTGTDAWDDVTGTALAGVSTTLPQFCVHKDSLVFTNEGLNQPRKLTGSGNSATLGGTPPYAKGMCQGWGFLFLLNVSTDGITFTPRQCIYSDDYDVSWDLCNGNDIFFNETPGELITGVTLGDVIVIFKSDAVHQLAFEGGPVRFRQPRLPLDAGLLAPLSAVFCPGFGIPFLDTAYRLTFTDGHVIRTLPPLAQKKLDETLYKPRARWAVGGNYPDVDSYTIFYQSSASDTFNRNRITINHKTGEFSHRVYTAHEFARLGLFRYNRNTAYTMIASTSTLVYELDAATETEDGTVLNRYYDIDWTDLGERSEKYLTGVQLEAVRNANGRISISVASDMNPQFNYEQFFDLKGGSPDDEYILLTYRIDPGLKGHRFKVRIRFFHDDGSVVEVIPPVSIFYVPESDDSNPQYSRSPFPTRTE